VRFDNEFEILFVATFVGMMNERFTSVRLLDLAVGAVLLEPVMND